MEAAGIERPEEYHGIKQPLFTELPMNYSFDDAGAPNAKKVQYDKMFGKTAIWADGCKAVTLHEKRMPWIVNFSTPFEDEVWELYNVNEDFSESTDLAETFPEKLEELKKLWDQKAVKNNVFPLCGDMIKRRAAINNILFGNQKKFVYFAPGAVRTAEKTSAPVKNRSHRIETTIGLKGDEEGVIVSCGGMTGSYSRYIKSGKLQFDYNLLDGVHYHLTSRTRPKGNTDLKFNCKRTKLFGDTGKLYVNGAKVDETGMPRMHISTYSLAKTFDIGFDYRAQVDRDYEDRPFPFTGKLDRVRIALTD